MSAIGPRSSHLGRAGSLGAGLALILMACGPAATSVPTGAPPTTAPTAAGPAEPCATTPGTGCTMFGGKYRSTRFGTGVAFTLTGDQWSNTANEPDVLFLYGGALSGFGVVPDETIVFVNGAPQISSGATPAAVKDPEQAKTTLGGISGLTVTAAGGTVIDGQGGVVFRVANASTAPITLWHFPSTTGAGSYDLAAGSSTEVHWLSVGGVPVLVALMAPTIKLEDWVTGLDGVIKSIKFG